MSIINDKYKGKYKGASDWIGRVIEAKATKVPEGAKEGAKAELYLPDLFKLARANKLDSDKINSLENQQSQKNAPGRIRMTIGNMLRAAAKRRHGLVDIDGTTLTPDADFELPEEPTEDLAGNKVETKAQAEKKAAKAAADKAKADAKAAADAKKAEDKAAADAAKAKEAEKTAA